MSRILGEDRHLREDVTQLTLYEREAILRVDTENKRREIAKRLDMCIANNDPEIAHGEADDCLCELLCHLGYGDIVDRYRRVEKWYA